ncbi:phosphopentomutase [Lutispora thermophila]|uniref:phosphopentomutase n=1 Tax=Lutispora thermophila TaxID=288966 RepID=UPI00093292F1|nr:phosphopentomutase [Lutispora thermophila]
MNRVVLIVLDSLGIGYLPDAYKYGDEGSDTLGNIAKYHSNFRIDNLVELGIGNIDGISKYVKKSSNPKGAYGRAEEASYGKDTTTGHWEIAGLKLTEPFPTFPNAFPDELIKKIEDAIDVKTIGNEVASGTEIINRLGDLHVKTGKPIIYTSADSVLQIAAHEDVIKLEKLYEICGIVRDIMKGPYGVGRIIARPFVGKSGEYKRTPNRKDFSLKPIGKTMLDYIKECNMDVIAVGKIENIFASQGITHSAHTESNLDGINKTIQFINENNKGLIFTNLVDFDMLYGHRNDVEGYGDAIMEFDRMLPNIISTLKDEDILIITADHGCDPSTPSTDHSREYVPILIYGRNIKNNVNIGTRNCFCDLGATILDILNIKGNIEGLSFKSLIIKE